MKLDYTMKGSFTMLYEFTLLVRHAQVRGRALKHWALWALATAFGWSLASYAGLPIGRVVLAEGGAEAILSVGMTMGVLGIFRKLTERWGFMVTSLAVS